MAPHLKGWRLPISLTFGDPEDREKLAGGDRREPPEKTTAGSARTLGIASVTCSPEALAESPASMVFWRRCYIADRAVICWICAPSVADVTGGSLVPRFACASRNPSGSLRLAVSLRSAPPANISRAFGSTNAWELHAFHLLTNLWVIARPVREARSSKPGEEYRWTSPHAHTCRCEAWVPWPL